MDWVTEKRKLKQLVGFTSNPRKLSDKQRQDLKFSLEKFNLVEIPAINKDNTIIAGHQRIDILNSLHDADFEIEVRVPKNKLSNNDVKEYLIRSNKNTGDWDFALLHEYFDNVDLNNWGFDFEDCDLSMDSSFIEDLNEGTIVDILKGKDEYFSITFTFEKTLEPAFLEKGKEFLTNELKSILNEGANNA